MAACGRTLGEFLNGLDNLHEYMRFTFPKMRAPTFICSEENREGLILHYRYALKQIFQLKKASEVYDEDRYLDSIFDGIKYGLRKNTKTIH